jgi:diguanylate cyclase
LKQWVHKLIDQLDFDYGWSKGSKKAKKIDINEDRATLLYILDVYNKHLVEIDGHPVRKVREILDELAKELVNPKRPDSDKLLFRLRQFFSIYRVDEYTYIRKTFEDFKGIIWDFVDQLAEDFKYEQTVDKDVKKNLAQLKEAVEADSIDLLRSKSREFIDSYVEHQTKREERRTKRIRGMRKNLDSVRKKLVEADRTSRMDHLTGAYNRRSFDDQMKQLLQFYELSKTPVSLIILDIDFFKKINDSYGHDVGDFVLKECVRMLQSIYTRDSDFLARIGGEEFAIILPDYRLEHAVKKAEETLSRIRKEVFITGSQELRFTVSLGIAELRDGETADQWLKRADSALYEAKNNGRNRFTIAGQKPEITQVA